MWRQTQERVALAHARAKEFAERQQDYAQAVQILETIPEHLRKRKLFEELVRRRDRVRELDALILERVTQFRSQGLREAIAELLQLQPNRQDAKKLLAELPGPPSREETTANKQAEVNEGGNLPPSRPMIDGSTSAQRSRGRTLLRFAIRVGLVGTAATVTFFTGAFASDYRIYGFVIQVPVMAALVSTAAVEACFVWWWLSFINKPHARPDSAESLDGPGSPRAASDKLQRASKTRRILAFIVDFVLTSFAAIPIAIWSGGSMALWTNDWVRFVYIGFVFAASYSTMNSYTWASYGQSLGKKICGIRICDRGGGNPGLTRILLYRTLPQYIVFVVPVLGPLNKFFDVSLAVRADRSCLHDHIAGTCVVKV